MVKDTVKKIVIETLNISEDRYREDLAIGDIPEWDSLGHVQLLQRIEAEFQIALDVADAIDIETIEDIVDAVNKYKMQS